MGGLVQPENYRLNYFTKVLLYCYNSFKIVCTALKKKVKLWVEFITMCILCIGNDTHMV